MHFLVCTASDINGPRLRKYSATAGVVSNATAHRSFRAKVSTEIHHHLPIPPPLQGGERRREERGSVEWKRFACFPKLYEHLSARFVHLSDCPKTHFQCFSNFLYRNFEKCTPEIFFQNFYIEILQNKSRSCVFKISI